MLILTVDFKINQIPIRLNLLQFTVTVRSLFCA